VRRIILKTFQSPGDVLMLTAAVRDLHAAHPGMFQTDVRTSADALWLNNPHITRLNEQDAGVEAIDCHYPLVHQANSRPYHFIHGYAQFLEQRLGVPIPLTRFCGDIHLSAEEKQRPTPFAELGVKEGFWIIIAGGKHDFTAKWWNPASYQAVVDHFSSRHTPCAVRPIQFVQCGEAGHWHPRLKGVIDLVGRTNTRELVVLVYHSAGVLCPVTFAMHLAAAVPMRANGVARLRPCVVVAGAREPAHWEQYPGHQFLHTIGSLPCCAKDPCWRSRCQLVGDGDQKDRQNVCERPVQISPELRIPKCMDMISADDVIRAIERFVGIREQVTGNRGGVPRVLPLPLGEGRGEGGLNETAVTIKAVSCDLSPVTSVLIDFRHGLGDAVQLTTVLAHLRHYHPDWQIDVAAGIGKLPTVDDRRHHAPRDAHHAEHDDYGRLPLYHRLLIRDRDHIDRAAYKHVFDLSWDECPTASGDSPSTKAEHCVRSVFQSQPIAELCRYELSIGDRALQSAKSYLESICARKCLKATDNGQPTTRKYPVVLLHYQGNTSSERKDLSHELAHRVCEAVIESGFVPVILDWDKRTPLADEIRIFNPGADSPLWNNTGTGDCETLAALIAQASLFVGIDSGPLHVAGANLVREDGLPSLRFYVFCRCFSFKMLGQLYRRSPR
jgi:ADP-heptose:LPS heptosyltransferase